MSGMFGYNNTFSGNISSWNVSNVSNFSSMFIGASNFNSDLSNWDVSSAVDFSNMFDDTILSDENKCKIHSTWLSNSYWSYDWSDICTRLACKPTKDESTKASTLASV